MLTETYLISIPGAFLIVYIIMMVIEGFPLFMIELAVGQSIRKSAPSCWATIDQALKGVSVACWLASGLLCMYYICVIAWCLQYFFASFQKTLPWSINNCPRWINSFPTNILILYSLEMQGDFRGHEIGILTRKGLMILTRKNYKKKCQCFWA